MISSCNIIEIKLNQTNPFRRWMWNETIQTDQYFDVGHQEELPRKMAEQAKEKNPT